MKKIAGMSLVAAFLVAACGGAAATPAPTVAPTTAPTPTTAGTPAGAVNVTLVSTALGTIVVGPNGKTLYGFTPDQAAGKPTCNADCAALWPPLTVSGDFGVGTGLDKSIFKTVARDDGSQQLAIGQFPLYYYAPDAKPGDTTGQGLFGKWFVVGATGALIGQAAGSASPGASAGSSASPSSSPSAVTTVTVATNALGQILVGPNGNTLYGFTPDEAAGKPTCNTGCIDSWPALTVTGTDYTLGTGLDKSKFKLVARDDGTMQLQVGNYPLYYFAADAYAGDTNGQGKFGKWFVANPDGELIGEPGG
jgi:predicted lipoprotein with Yx(FWY)xxD motif